MKRRSPGRRSCRWRSKGAGGPHVRKAAEQGNLYAQHNLGYNYKNGRGAAKNLAEAERLLKLSAEQGYASAQYQLGMLYRQTKRGLLSLSLPKEAREWLQKAADQGHEKAKQMLS